MYSRYYFFQLPALLLYVNFSKSVSQFPFSKIYLIEIEREWYARIRNMYICRSSYYRYTWQMTKLSTCSSPLIKRASGNEVSECNKVLSSNVITNVPVQIIDFTAN